MTGISVCLGLPDDARRILRCRPVSADCQSYNDITCGLSLPSTVAPMAPSKDGLPIGVQIAARRHDDRTTTIAVAGLIEALNGGFVAPGWE